MLANAFDEVLLENSLCAIGELYYLGGGDTYMHHISNINKLIITALFIKKIKIKKEKKSSIGLEINVTPGTTEQ